MPAGASTSIYSFSSSSSTSASAGFFPHQCSRPSPSHLSIFPLVVELFHIPASLVPALIYYVLTVPFLVRLTSSLNAAWTKGGGGCSTAASVARAVGGDQTPVCLQRPPAPPDQTTGSKTRFVFRSLSLFSFDCWLSSLPPFSPAVCPLFCTP